MNASPRLWIAMACVAGLLTACGGGGDSSTPAAAAAPEWTSGAVTGFGSVIVEGKAYDDSSAVVRLEADPTQPQSAALGDLKLGMQVELTASSDAASAVTIVSTVVGRIQSLTADGFVVAGQTVRVVSDAASPTVFDGATGLADLAADDVVEVHGNRDELGTVVATRVERKDPRAALFVRVVGSIANLDTAAKTFTIGGLTVGYAGSVRIVPSATSLANGSGVVIWSDAAPVGNALQARAIRLRQVSPATGDAIRTGGLVRQLEFAARRFSVDGLPVDAAAARFSNGSANDLANGRRVRVLGTWQADRLQASEVRFPHPQGDEAVTLTGAITDYAGPHSFRVRGVPVDASASTVRFIGGDASSLADGVLVRLQGQVSGDGVKPRVLTFPSTVGDNTRRLVGSVNGYDPAAGTFRLYNIAMTLAADARFLHADLTPASRADFGNGDRVRVRARLASGQPTVTEVTLLDDAGVVINRVGGNVTDVQVSLGVFRLNGVVVRTDGATSWSGDRVNLRSGVQVHVEGSVVNGELVARSVEITGADEASRVRAVGDITAWSSLASFSVAGQRVDGSAALVVGGSAATLAEGDAVEVRGPVVDGVVRATLIRLR